MTIALDATLAALRAEFPAFRVWTEPAGGQYRFVARRRHPGTGLHTVVTGDPAELRVALAAAHSAQQPAQPAQPAPTDQAAVLPALADRAAALPALPHGRPAVSRADHGESPDGPQSTGAGDPDEPRPAGSGSA